MLLYVSKLWQTPPPPHPGAGPVLTPGASCEQTWYRSTRRCYIPNIKALHLLVSENNIFKVFLLCSYDSNLWPRGGASFDPRDIIWTILVEVHYEMLHTKYQSSRPSSFWEEDFQRFCNFLPFGCHGNQTNGWNSISWTTLVELHPRNIPAKFHQDWPSGLGGEDV